MLVLIALLVILGLFCAILGYRSRKKGESQEIVVGKGDCATCTDDNPSCEQMCMMKASTKPVEYFDDEELDAYKGKASDEYDEDETAQFAEVLETLKANEIKAWNRSLILRGINMPDGIKDEYIALAESDHSN